MIAYACTLNGPTQIALALTDRYGPAMRGATTPSTITPIVHGLIHQVEEIADEPVVRLDTGPLLTNIIDL